MLLAIANFAHHDGGGAYPSRQTLARMVRRSVRQVAWSTKRLEAMHELQVQRSPGRRPNVYRVLVGAGITSANPDTDVTVESVTNGDTEGPPMVTPVTANGDMAASPNPGSNREKNRQRETTAASTPSLSALRAPRTRTRTKTGQKRPLPTSFVLSDARQQIARKAGIPQADVPRLFQAFTAWQRKNGSTAVDWDAAWELWCLRERPAHDDRARHGGADLPPTIKAVAERIRAKATTPAPKAILARSPMPQPFVRALMADRSVPAFNEEERRRELRRQAAVLLLQERHVHDKEDGGR